MTERRYGWADWTVIVVVGVGLFAAVVAWVLTLRPDLVLLDTFRGGARVELPGFPALLVAAVAGVVGVATVVISLLFFRGRGRTVPTQTAQRVPVTH